MKLRQTMKLKQELCHKDQNPLVRYIKKGRGGYHWVYFCDVCKQETRREMTNEEKDYFK